MDTDKLTTWLGAAQAAAIAAVDFYATSNADGTVGWTNPMFWVGIAAAVLVAVKAYFTNKTAVLKP